MHRYIATSGGRDFEVEVEPIDEGQVRVRVDGRPYLLDARVVRNGKDSVWLLLHGARVFTYDVAAQAGKMAVCARGGAFDVRVTDAGRHALLRARQAEGVAEGAQILRASIPGKIVRCLVKPGDGVRAGQGVVILEAMKMENELRAARAGRVREIAVREGQAVETGETLVVIES